MERREPEPAWDRPPSAPERQLQELEARLFPRLLAWLLQHIYAEPGDWLDATTPPRLTEERWRRQLHQDLAWFTLPALRDERARLRLRLMLDPLPSAWLAERLRRIEAALDSAPGGRDADA